MYGDLAGQASILMFMQTKPLLTKMGGRLRMLLINTYICGETTMPLFQNISKPCELVRSPVYLDSRNKFQALGVLIIPRNESQVWQSTVAASSL